MCRIFCIPIVRRGTTKFSEKRFRVDSIRPLGRGLRTLRGGFV